jgi:hypothetical protein
MEIHFGTWKHMLLPLEKTFPNVKTRIWRVHLDILCAHAQVSWKADKFCVWCKKTKKYREEPF